MTNSILGQVTTGVTQAGQRIVIAGVEKVGKTTLACAAPGALLVPLEQGYSAIPVTKTPMLNSWEEVEALCLELIATAQTGKIPRGSSIVWDSATALERMIDSYSIRTDPDYSKKGGKLTMATAHGAYGKAYEVSRQTFEKWTRYMDALAFHGGINIIVTCHVFASRVVDPAHGEYDTWDLLLHSPKNNRTYGIREFLSQWADLIGFFHEPMFVIKAEGENVNRGMSKNEGRVLAVDRTPAWVAGNRYGLRGTIAIPPPEQLGKLAVNSWNALASPIYNACGVDVWNRS